VNAKPIEAAHHHKLQTNNKQAAADPEISFIGCF
jgi:hypothetical protein